MKTSAVPVICGTVLAAMSAAGISHWWSVNSFVSLVDAGLPVSSTVAPAPKPVEIPQAKPAVAAPIAQAPKHTKAPDEVSQTKFYEALLTKMESLQNQNRDLLDQVAETNRDVMKLEFRVDTHSESFRPMPLGEERATSFEDGPGVLPPRAEPVFLPGGE
jgi:predicted RNase H-like nuclease (RuvC/YqgF family)